MPCDKTKPPADKAGTHSVTSTYRWRASNSIGQLRAPWVRRIINRKD